MNILYLGNKDKYGYSYYQYSIIKKRYKKIDFIEIKRLNFYTYLLSILSWHINLKFFDKIIYISLKNVIKKKYDLVYIHNENLLGLRSINFLKSISKKTFFYCPDNPFVKRDKYRWKLIVNNLKLFDLVIFMQKNRLKYCKKFGIKNVIWIPPTFKIKKHNNNIEKKKIKNDIIIIATYFPERGKLASLLFKNNLKLKIFGNYWNRFQEYSRYKQHIKPKVTSDKKYVHLIKNSKISICLPSIKNDDDITNRSFEIPYIGALLVAKKTKTHEIFFKNKKNVIFFRDLNECVVEIKKILKNEGLRQRIALNGHKHIKKISKNLSFENNFIKIIKFYF